MKTQYIIINAISPCLLLNGRSSIISCSIKLSRFFRSSFLFAFDSVSTGDEGLETTLSLEAICVNPNPISGSPLSPKVNKCNKRIVLLNNIQGD